MDSGAGSNLLRALGGEAVWPPPLWLMRQAGRALAQQNCVRKPKNLSFRPIRLAGRGRRAGMAEHAKPKARPYRPADPAGAAG